MLIETPRLCPAFAHSWAELRASATTRNVSSRTSGVRSTCGTNLASRTDGQDDELVSADSRDGVHLAHDRLEAPGKGLQHHVAGAVATDVVDVLEPVEVDHDQRER